VIASGRQPLAPCLAGLLCALTACVTPIASQYEVEQPRVQDRTGLLAGIGGGGGIDILESADAKPGYAAEARLGYGFTPAMQLYLSAAFDSANHDNFGTLRNYQVTVQIQHYLVARRAVGAFVHAGIGLAIADPQPQQGLLPGTSATGYGLATSGGVGMDIRIANDLYLAPELFYRRANVNAQGSGANLDAIGLMLSLIYY